MKKAMRACLGGLLAVLLSTMVARAEKPEPDSFVLTLPADWELAEPMRFTYLEGGTLLVRHKRCCWKDSRSVMGRQSQVMHESLSHLLKSRLLKAVGVFCRLRVIRQHNSQLMRMAELLPGNDNSGKQGALQRQAGKVSQKSFEMWTDFRS